MQKKKSIIKELEQLALEGGATAVKPINPEDVVIARWVLDKCQFGCRTFGKRFTCPPYAPTPAETAETLRSYDRALLIEFDNMSVERLKQDEAAKNMVHEVSYGMEIKAFLAGYEKAFSYGAGPCALCPDCPAEKLENPNLFSKKDCRHPKKVRPSMEAAGMDVYSTVRKVGSHLEVVRDRSESFKCFSLLLLE